jgi:SAM-dependent methyltransferase
MVEIDYSIQYRNWHNDTIEHYESHVNYYKRNFGYLLPNDKNINILDVGCGYGLALYAFKKMGYQNLKGIDISPQLAKVAQSKGLNVELVEDSIKWLEEHKETFDVIFCLDVLEHIEIDSQIKFLKAINGALKINGLFICTVPNANSTFASRWLYNDWTHKISFSEHSLEFLILNSGFSSVSISEIEFMQRPKYPWLIRKSVLHWLLFKTFRFIRRLEAIAELGSEGRSIPLSLNLKAVAKK